MAKKSSKKRAAQSQPVSVSVNKKPKLDAVEIDVAEEKILLPGGLSLYADELDSTIDTLTLLSVPARCLALPPAKLKTLRTVLHDATLAVNATNTVTASTASLTARISAALMDCLQTSRPYC